MKNLKQLLLLLLVALGLATSCSKEEMVCPSLMAPTVDKTTIAVGEELLINYSSTLLNGFTYEITEGDSFVEVLEKDSMHYIKGLAEGVATIMATNGGGTSELVITVGDLPSLETDLVLVGDSIRILNASNDLGFTYNITAGSENISVLDNDSVFYILGTKGGTAVITLSNAFGEVEDSVYISNVYLKDGYYVDYQGLKYNIDSITGDASVAGANLGAGPNFDVDFSAINGEVCIWANLYYERAEFPVVSIEKNAFLGPYNGGYYGNSSLKALSFDVGSNIKRIGESAVHQCEELTKVDFTNCTKLDTIERAAFYICRKLETIDFTDCSSLKYISDVTFMYNIVPELDFSDCTALETIGGSAFFSSYNITSLDFTPCTSLKTIGEQAFLGSEKLETLILPKSLETIESSAFNDCEALQSIDFSQCTELSTIGLGAFVECKALKTADLSACTSLTAIEERVFIVCSSLTSVKLPTSIVSIGEYAFDFCSSLTDINLTDCQGLKTLDAYAFRNCDPAMPITLPGADSEWTPSGVITVDNWTGSFSRP